MEASSSVFRNLVELCRYYTGLPREAVESNVVAFTSEREFVQLLHEGQPVAVAFTFRCAHTQHFDRMFEKASEEFHPFVRFVRVECPSHLGFCIARQRKDFPFIEIFHSSKEGQRDEGGIVRYSVMVTPYNYDVSPYGFRQYFKRNASMFPMAATVAAVAAKARHEHPKNLFRAQHEGLGV